LKKDSILRREQRESYRVIYIERVSEKERVYSESERVLEEELEWES